MVLALTVNIIVQYLKLRDENLFFEISQRLNAESDVLMLGSSVNGHIAKGETDTRRISEVLNDLVTEFNINHVSRGSASFTNYFAYLRYKERKNSLPEKIIVPINIQSYSPFNCMRPEYRTLQVNENIYLNYGVVPYIMRHFVPFFQKQYSSISHEKYERQELFKNNVKVGTVGKYMVVDEYRIKGDSAKIADAFMVSYMVDLDSATVEKNLTGIIDLCKRNNLELFFYATPIDYQAGVKFKGEAFIQKVKENNEYVFSIIKEQSTAPIFDYTFSLDSTYFDYEILPNPHMYLKGKMFVAKSLKEDIFKLEH